MIRFFNTLSREKEEFKPLSGEAVTMYSCGPTVYNYAHIGNLRSYIFMDSVRRALKLNGFKIKGVLNITDVGHLVGDSDDGEDKVTVNAKKLNKSPYEIADYFTKAFFEDLEALNIEKPEIIAKATDNIKEMINYVVELEKLGYAYETDDGIYFDISKFSDYGKLSRINLDEQQGGARVEVNSQKRHHADFALWKKAPKEHIMQWESPWGMGFPGWHIECSAMSKKFLGKVLDIHSGGVDHIPIHHENEIAQSEALEGQKTVNYWMHGEFLLVDNGKMSKSLGNVYTVKDLVAKGYSALDFRYFCLNAHYRKKLNFTWEGLDGAKTAFERLRENLAAHRQSDVKTSHETLEKYREEFMSAINDDVNVPQALGILWTAVKEPKSKDIFMLAVEFDRMFGLGLDKVKTEVKNAEIVDAPPDVTALAEERLKAKKDKDFSKADALRAEILKKGYAVIDVPGGYKLEKV